MLAVLVCIWVYRAARGSVTVRSLPVDYAFAAYAALSLLAATFSFDPVSSLQASKKLLLLLVPYLLVSSVRRKSSVEALVIVLIVMADVGALVGLWQYQFGELGDLNSRIRGFMGHYMTYSGLLMSVGVLAIAQALFYERHRAFALGRLRAHQCRVGTHADTKRVDRFAARDRRPRVSQEQEVVAARAGRGGRRSSRLAARCRAPRRVVL